MPKKTPAANPFRTLLWSLCLCLSDVRHPTQPRNYLFRRGTHYRFRPVLFSGAPHYAVGNRYQHYRLPDYMPSGPVFERWAYYSPAEFFRLFSPLWLFQLDSIPPAKYRLSRRSYYDPLFLTDSAAWIPRASTLPGYSFPWYSFAERPSDGRLPTRYT